MFSGWVRPQAGQLEDSHLIPAWSLNPNQAPCRFKDTGRLKISSMNKLGIIGLATAGVLTPIHVHALNTVSQVLQYSAGTGFATEFGSGLGYTNTAAVLGEPARANSGPFGGPVDPFNPPFQRDQLLSIGAGGSLTVRLAGPVLNRPQNAFGLDFIVYGNTGFSITNGDFTGGGVTDGSTFGANEGRTRISVSMDNITYYTLTPLLAPNLDGLFPTDGSGAFGVPVDPTLKASDFNGKGLDGIRSLYGGGAGGTGFDLDWAVDGSGTRVHLEEVNFLRIDVISGSAEIDAITAVPEPSTWALSLTGLAGLCFCGARRWSEKAKLTKTN